MHSERRSGGGGEEGATQVSGGGRGHTSFGRGIQVSGGGHTSFGRGGWRGAIQVSEGGGGSYKFLSPSPKFLDPLLQSLGV